MTILDRALIIDFLAEKVLCDDKVAYHWQPARLPKKLAISEVVRVLQQEQQYIGGSFDPRIKFKYLFSANEGGAKKGGGFVPKPKPMTRNAFSQYLNRSAKSRNICDATGKLWHFQTHQFRHTVGTRMINNGVPQHIIQRYLGNESPNMTAVYVTIHDQTLKKEIASFQGRAVNIAGQVVEATATPEADSPDLQWFKRNVQAQALPNGSCALPTISQGCPHANACLTCTHFRTSTEHLAEHKNQLQQTDRIIAKAEANGWTRVAEMNQQVKTNLENIIEGLENDNTES